MSPLTPGTAEIVSLRRDLEAAAAALAKVTAEREAARRQLAEATRLLVCVASGGIGGTDCGACDRMIQRCDRVGGCVGTEARAFLATLAQPATTPAAVGEPFYIGIDPAISGSERTFHRCSGCEWFIESTCMDEKAITTAVRAHLRADHNAVFPAATTPALVPASTVYVDSKPPVTDEQSSCGGCGRRSAPWEGWQRPDEGACWWLWEPAFQMWTFLCRDEREDEATPALVTTPDHAGPPWDTSRDAAEFEPLCYPHGGVNLTPNAVSRPCSQPTCKSVTFGVRMPAAAAGPLVAPTPSTCGQPCDSCGAGCTFRKLHEARGHCCELHGGGPVGWPLVAPTPALGVPCSVRCWRVGGPVTVASGEVCPECGNLAPAAAGPLVAPTPEPACPCPNPGDQVECVGGTMCNCACHYPPTDPRYRGPAPAQPTVVRGPWPPRKGDRALSTGTRDVLTFNGDRNASGGYDVTDSKGRVVGGLGKQAIDGGMFQLIGPEVVPSAPATGEGAAPATTREDGKR